MSHNGGPCVVGGCCNWPLRAERVDAVVNVASHPPSRQHRSQSRIFQHVERLGTVEVGFIDNISFACLMTGPAECRRANWQCRYSAISVDYWRSNTHRFRRRAIYGIVERRRHYIIHHWYPGRKDNSQISQEVTCGTWIYLIHIPSRMSTSFYSLFTRVLGRQSSPRSSWWNFCFVS